MLNGYKSLLMGAGLALAATLPAQAQKAPNHIPCGLGIVENYQTLFQRASFQPTAVPAGNVRVTFVGHSTFQIETPKGATAATDYAGFHIPDQVPNIITMNNSHTSHYTDVFDPDIKHVLRGWDPKGGIARHHVRLMDLRVYNLPTNIFNFGDGATNGNSVFVFEAAGLCLAHLGHLHHFLSKKQVSDLGRIDILFVPIDGMNTLSHEESTHIIDQIKPRVVMPMHLHFGGAYSFPAIAEKKGYQVKFLKKDTMLVNRANLPEKTEVWFLVENL